MTDDEVVAGTLAWCNEMRAQKSQEPLDTLPKGYRNDPLSCPCGVATGLFVDNEYYSTSREALKAGQDVWQLPTTVETFVHLFDGGELPEYDAARPEGDNEDADE